MICKDFFYLCLLLGAITNIAAMRRMPPCMTCEEEIWEEVPCDGLAIPTTSTTSTSTTTTTTTTTTTPPPETTPMPPMTTTPMPVATLPPTTAAPETTAPISSAYENCYCECKVGCKDFCSKVVINRDNQKQITQMASTLHTVPNGLIEVKHLHQRNFQPTAKAYPPPNEGYNAIASPQPTPIELPVPGAYNGNNLNYLLGYQNTVSSVGGALPVYQNLPVAGAPSYLQNAMADSEPYTLDEITRLLQMDGPNSYAKPLPAYVPTPVTPKPYTAPIPQRVTPSPLPYLPSYNKIVAPKPPVAYKAPELLPPIPDNYKSEEIASQEGTCPRFYRSNQAFPVKSDAAVVYAIDGDYN